MKFFDWINFGFLRWKSCASCPVARTEGGGIQLGSQFFIFGGFHTIDQVLSDVDVLDLETGCWVDRFQMPSEMPHTHVGLTSDEERYIYCVGGQKGPRCSPCVADCFVLDTQQKQWNKLPPLPKARYASALQLWRGRLHALGGSKEDRVTPATDHWSIAVSQGKALESTWRAEQPVPKGGPHRTSIILDDKFYIFGGEIGDVKAIAGDPQFKCDWKTPMEIVYGDTYVLENLDSSWKKLADMPLPTTHMETSIFKMDHLVVMAGGNITRNKMSNRIQIFDTQANTWRDGGRLPYCMKTTMAYYNGWMYLITGQRAQSARDPQPGPVLNNVWRTKFSNGF